VGWTPPPAAESYCLAAESDRHTLAEQTDFVLCEDGQQRRIRVRRRHRQSGVPREPLFDEPVAGAGDHIVARAQGPVVLHVEVEGPPRIVSDRFLVAGDVDKRLDLQGRAAGTGAGPPSERVSASRCGRIGDQRVASSRQRVEIRPEHLQVTCGEVALEHERVTARGPVGAESGSDAM
jgi:hypothetical protein